jgi:hypothetical protein
MLTYASHLLQCLAASSGKQLDSEAIRSLEADVRMEINSLKNAAYASGFSAARGAMRAQLEPMAPLRPQP